MKRRAFLGFLGGGAVAGPKLAASIGEQVALSGGSPAFGWGMGTLPVPASTSDGDWRVSRIAQIRRWFARSGEEDAKERRQLRQYQVEALERFRLDSLRSVSAQHKMQMFIEGNIERQMRIRHESHETELAELLLSKIG